MRKSKKREGLDVYSTKTSIRLQGADLCVCVCVCTTPQTGNVKDWVIFTVCLQSSYRFMHYVKSSVEMSASSSTHSSTKTQVVYYYKGKKIPITFYSNNNNHSDWFRYGSTSGKMFILQLTFLGIIGQEPTVEF